MKDILKKLAVGASSSGALKLNFTDIKKLGVNALLVGAASTILYLSNGIKSEDFGAFTPIVIPLVTAALEAAYRWVKDNSSAEVKPEEVK
jgi:hypothetical protein